MDSPQNNQDKSSGQKTGTENAGSKDGNAPVSPGHVLDFLHANPGFVVENFETLTRINAEEKERQEGVVDFQQAMIGRLREQVAQTEDMARVLIDTSRDNLSNMARIHDCVLSLLDAHSFEDLIHSATVDLAVKLDIDVAVLCVESNDAFGLPLRALRLLPQGAVDASLGLKQRILLQRDISADPAIFKEAASLVASQALVRLTISPEAPPAMLAFGSRDPDHFHGGQSTELLQFLSQVLEKLIRVWLDLPDEFGN